VRTRPLGSTGLVVSEIGLGLAALGRPGYINLGHSGDVGSDKSIEAMRSQAWTVLDRAHGQGVRYFDAARSYGLAEEFLASWLRQRGPEEVVVGSKWGYRYTAGWRTDVDVHEVKDHSRGAFDEQYAESRSLLAGRLNLYQIHSAVLETGVLEDEAVLAALVAMADDGVVAGLSVSGAAQADVVRRALAASVDGVNPFRCVQATWNLLEPSAGAALAEASAAGWGVIVKEAVANGRLTARNADGIDPAIDAAAGRRGVGIDAIAIAAALAQPWASVVLSGATTVDQLDGNLAASSVVLDDEEPASLLVGVEPPSEYWKRRSVLPWT
jgi:aryl-alcohol dehydrogenase-like predicted oxidoreductase